MNILQQAPISSYLAPGASAQQAEARDGGGHHGHHAAHGHDEQHHVEHAAAAPVSSFELIICRKMWQKYFSKVAPAAPEPAYQAPVSQGNLYYYYYPVQVVILSNPCYVGTT